MCVEISIKTVSSLHKLDYASILITVNSAVSHATVITTDTMPGLIKHSK